uniref:Uncharacterized protein n=1 Tax=Glossina pallidipes TaxID=7398 RepID=A0A1A9ZRV3_GLOPL
MDNELTVAIVSPENDGSNTTKPPCTPLSERGGFTILCTVWVLFKPKKSKEQLKTTMPRDDLATRKVPLKYYCTRVIKICGLTAQRVLYWGMPRATSSQARTCDARQRSIGSEEASRNKRKVFKSIHSVAPSAERALFLLRDLANTREILPQVPPRALRAVKFVPDLAGNFRTTAPVASESTVMQGPLSQVPSLKFKSPPVLSRSLLFLSTESFEQEFRSPVVFPELLLNADSEFELPRPLSSLRKLLVAVFGN